MDALLFPFGSPVNEARTLIASNVEDNVRVPGVVEANADPEKTGKLASTNKHTVHFIFFIAVPISRLPGRVAHFFPESVVSTSPALRGRTQSPQPETKPGRVRILLQRGEQK